MSGSGDPGHRQRYAKLARNLFYIGITSISGSTCGFSQRKAPTIAVYNGGGHRR